MAKTANEWKTLASLPKPYLDSNLEVLAHGQPELVASIRSEQSREDILLRPIQGGFYECRMIQQDEEIAVPHVNVIQHTQQIVQAIMASFQKGTWLSVVLGTGLGFAIHQAARKLEEQHRSEPKGILCIEPDAGWLCAAFSLLDFSQPLKTGRLLFITGTSFVEPYQTLCHAHSLGTLNPNQISFVEGRSLQTSLDIRDEFLRVHHQARQRYFDVLKQAEVYWNAPRSSLTRIWTHQNTDRGGAEMLLDLIEGFNQHGCEAKALLMQDHFFTRFYRVAYDFYAFHPDLVLCLNHSSDYSMSFARDIPIKRAIWYVDHPVNTAEIPYHPLDQMFVVSDGFTPEILRRGGTKGHRLHAAASCSQTMCEPSQAYKHAVSYVGTVHDNRAILNEIETSLRDRIEAFITLMLNQPERPDIRDELTKQLSDEEQTQLASLLSRHIPKGRVMASGCLIAYFVYMEANTRRRIEAISYLTEFSDIGIYGPSAWNDLLPKSLKPFFYGSIDSRDALLDLYRHSRINLSINSLQGFDFINQRVFDVFPNGGFLVQEKVPQVDELFPQAPDCWFDSWERMSEQIQFWLSHEKQRVEAIRHWQRAIAQNHTYAHRAQEILAYLTT